MASLIIDHDVTVSNRLGGAAAFQIMGQYHLKVGAVHGNYGRYIQTYFFDVQQQNQQHMAAFPQQHQQRALVIVDKIRVALEQSNNTYMGHVAVSIRIPHVILMENVAKTSPRTFPMKLLLKTLMVILNIVAKAHKMVGKKFSVEDIKLPYQCGILFLNQKHSVPIQIPVLRK